MSINLNKKVVPLKYILWIPLGVYLASYLYLALYHQKLFLFTSVIHEGGLYTLLETTFYASHFLGHIPVHTVLAIYFVGTYLSLTKPQQLQPSKKHAIRLSVLLIVFLVASVIVSVKYFTFEDTISFIQQQKQSVVRYEQGGSWNLHLPSIMMQFLLIPVYIFILKFIFQRENCHNSRGDYLMVSSIILFLLITWLINSNPVCTFAEIWKDARYLGHSVRELLTFPLTYYPIPLYFFLKGEKRLDSSVTDDKSLLNKGATLGVVFIALLIYQAFVPLSQGISELAQNPVFAKAGGLPIPYLLSSHYFEHFLDTIYFTLLCLILFGFLNKPRKMSEKKQ